MNWTRIDAWEFQRYQLTGPRGLGFNVMRGYFGIGIENGKSPDNLGTLWRSAHNFGAAFMFVIGNRYPKQSADTTKAWRSIPLYHYETFAEFHRAIPYDCQLVGVEYPNDRSKPLPTFKHPERCVYLLGAEDHGLSRVATERCHQLTMIPGSLLEQSLNVAVAGSIVMYDRISRL
jgi:tRNA G18 (ribose-2'-O)-methylase SpoU